MMKVDFEGVPRLVQRVQYLHSTALAKLTLFNGDELHVECEEFMRNYPNLMQKDFTPEMLQDAYVGAEIFVARRFGL